MNDDPTSAKRRKELRDLRRAIVFFSQIGITMATSVLVGVILGRFLDNLLQATPGFTIIFSLAGVVAAFRMMYDMGMKQ